MKKRFFITSIVMLMTILTSFAYDFEVNGIYYNITSQSNLEVEVTFNPSLILNQEDLYDNSWYHNVKANRSYSGTIIIPSSVNYNNRTYIVSSIGEYAFGSSDTYSSAHYFPGTYYGDYYGNNYGAEITSISIPQSVKILKKGAFRFCNILTSVNGANGIEEIEDDVFIDCPITDFYWSSSLKSIGKASFQRTKLSSIDLSQTNIIEIGDNCFNSCASLTQVIIGNMMINLPSSCFSSCPKLLEIFLLSPIKPSGFGIPNNCNNNLEIYVPSTKIYGLGKEYISFAEDTFGYSGQSHYIEWSNNLKAYKCEIPGSECITKENNAGEYTQYLAATYSNGVDFTVEIPYEYKINKAPMTLSVNNVQREYGEPNPAFSCNITGWVNGENEQTIGITPSFDCEANQRSNVGDYRILASLEAPNYEITYQYGTLSILKAQLTASVINSTKIYGSPNPQFVLSFSGLKNDETSPSWEVQPIFNTVATERSSVGEYEVTASNGIATNYNISSYTTGVLSITKKDLTAKANDCERLYGEDNPEFTLSFIGFVNKDSETNFTSTPTAECIASINSNAGTYPITVNGGSSENYNFIYQDGTLTVNPLTVGFKDVYNSVTFDDMSVSVTEDFFYYVPEIFGPYNEEDFWLELMALDKDNRYPSQHVTSISGGEYAGDYINYSTFMLGAGKYIFNLTSKGTNPNVVANPSRAYVTVNRASTNLDWNASSPIRVKVGEKVDLGISYQADLWCTFNTDYDKELISLSSEGATTRNPHWYATGLKEGRTYLEFSIECKKNDFGFYDFSDSSTLYKEIIVSGYYEDGVEGVATESEDTTIVYNLQGVRMNVTSREELRNLEPGIYIINGKKEIIR